MYSKLRRAALCFLLIALVSITERATTYAQEIGNKSEANQVSAFVVGGQDTTPGEFPWQASVEVEGFNGHWCGGSLIHPKWVLTASHCLVGIDATRVVLGAQRIVDNESSQQAINVVRTVRHPDYDNNTLNNDIALLELAQPAQLNDRVALVPLISANALAPFASTGTLATVTGWGDLRDGSGEGSETLQKGSVPIVEQRTCQQSYPGEITRNMFCAGFPQGGVDSCQGDSGGPLVVPNNSGGWIQAGIVSWGEGCAVAGKPGVYTQLANYITWIEGFVGASTNPTPTSTQPPTSTPATPVPTPTSTPATPVPTPVTPLPTATPSPTTTLPTAEPAPSGSVIENGDFEDVEEGWTQSSTNGYKLIDNEVQVEPFSGAYVAWLGGDNNEVANLLQSIMVPNEKPVSLTFRYQIDSEDFCGYDYAWVRINNKAEIKFDLCADERTDEWIEQTISLDQYAGRQVTLRFHVKTDYDAVSSLLIDDVAVISQQASTPDPVDPDPVPTDSSVDLPNYDFENGPNGNWTEQSTQFGDGFGSLVVSSLDTPISASSGDYLAWLGGANNEVSNLSQQIALPNSGPISLAFDHFVLSEQTNCSGDSATVLVNGEVVATQVLCQGQNMENWQQQTVNLDAFRGQTVTIAFATKTDGQQVSGYFVDNVTILGQSSERVNQPFSLFVPLMQR